MSKLIKVGIIYVSHDRLSLKTFRFVVKGAYLFSPREQKNAGTGHWTVVPWNEGLGIVTLYYEVMFFVTSQI